MRVSVVIAFYNKIRELRLLLAGFERQSYPDFELVIADDGSREEVVTELQQIIKTSDLSIRHVWHEDLGWRKTTILNKAIKAATGEYLIFIDGDCIPHKHFVKDHAANARLGTALAGRRVKLSEKISRQLTEEKVGSGFLDRRPFSSMVLDTFTGDTKHVEKGLRFWGLVRQVYPRKNPKREILGCNFSLFKFDMLALNGFDERYAAPCTGEDTDIDLRFTNYGGKIRFFKFGAIQYHIYHRQVARTGSDDNHKILMENRDNKVAFTPFGINRENNDQN